MSLDARIKKLESGEALICVVVVAPGADHSGMIANYLSKNADRIHAKIITVETGVPNIDKKS